LLHKGRSASRKQRADTEQGKLWQQKSRCKKETKTCSARQTQHCQEWGGGTGTRAKERQQNKRGRTGKENEWGNGGRTTDTDAIWKELGIMKDVITAVGALTLDTAHQVREEKGYSLMTALVNPEWDFVEAGLAEGKIYGELVKKHKGEDIGPPHIRILVKVVESPSNGKSAKPEDTQKLKDWWIAHIARKSREFMKSEVQHFTIKKTQITKSKKWGEGTKEYAKVTWKFRSDFHMTLAQILENMGSKVLLGTAPRQYMEREVKEKIADWGKEGW
jgi:hypothetical protein